MMADRAPCGSTDETMMTGEMPCGAAQQSAFNAPFGLGRCRYGDKCNRNRGASKRLVHPFCSWETDRGSRSGWSLNTATAEKVPGVDTGPRHGVIHQ
jgi:hypothetical protein